MIIALYQPINAHFRFGAAPLGQKAIYSQFDHNVIAQADSGLQWRTLLFSRNIFIAGKII